MISRESEIATRIGNILLDILPEDAVSITADSKAAPDYASTKFTLQRQDGSTFRFPLDSHPKDAARDISLQVIDLWKVMTAEGQDPWYSMRFTVDRDGRFDTSFSYDRASA